MALYWAHGFGMLLASMFAAAGGLLALTAYQIRSKTSQSSLFDDVPPGTGFLFDGETLVDATPSAKVLLSMQHSADGPWMRLLAYLSPRFPDVENSLSMLPEVGELTLSMPQGTEDGLTLRAELRGGLTRIVVQEDQQQPGSGQDPLIRRAMEEELALLRATISSAPVLIWRETPQGEVTWANAAYLMQVTQRMQTGQELTWPLQRLFDRVAANQGLKGQRQRLDQVDGGRRWFDLIAIEDGEDQLLFGLPSDSAAMAEESSRDFMQTLAKTFAHLPIGLAIFDRQRQLALFNPALLDLSGLKPDFLSARPTLYAVLDAMRDTHMIPEPKDYRSWRKQITDLEQAASSGLYEETWNLPTGQTYRVIGRPHPNGAMALMFEDISTEMSRTRRYRAELEMGQSVIDALEDAIAVFDQNGLLMMTNAAYRTLWNHDPDSNIKPLSIAELTRFWRSQSATSPLWCDAESFVATMGERQPLSGDARLNDGRLITCQMTGLPAGASLARFKLHHISPAGTASFVTARTRKTA